MLTEIIRVSKKFTFDMAHALYGHDGLCKNIHGHTYHLCITLKGQVLKKPGDAKDGMLIDFSELKSLVNTHVLSVYDHSLVLNGNSPHAKLKQLDDHFERIVYFKEQPSCENLLLDIVQRIRPHLPTTVNLYSVRLNETSTSYAEWFEEDNS